MENELTAAQALEYAFRDILDLPDAASAWLLDLWGLFQFFDDIADGDPVDRPTLDGAIWASMATMPSNVFFQTHASWLIPAQATAVLKWMASDKAEREGRADARSYSWRAGYYDVVCLVTAICHGPSSEKSEAALTLYSETLADYLGEFPNA